LTRGVEECGEGSGGEEVDYVLNGFVGAVVGGFEFTGCRTRRR